MPTAIIGQTKQIKHMQIEKYIGKRILALRKSQKLTQEDLAGLAQVDRSHLSEIENGYKNISIHTLKKLADALQVKVAYLVEDDEPTPREPAPAAAAVPSHDGSPTTKLSGE
jgi:transcriptional regulator with XRE-family HTH domain